MKNRSQSRNNNDFKTKSNYLQNGSTLIEPDNGCKCHSSNGLHHFNCLPDHLRFNRYVHTGYRVDLSTWGCLKSLFYLHNESFNVYSHGMYRNHSMFYDPKRIMELKDSRASQVYQDKHVRNDVAYDAYFRA